MPLSALSHISYKLLLCSQKKKKNRTRVDRARNIAAFPTIIAHVSSWQGAEPIFLRVSLTRQISSRQRVMLHGVTLAFLFLFIDFYSDLIPANSFPHSLSQSHFYTNFRLSRAFSPILYIGVVFVI